MANYRFVVICPNGHEAMQERFDRAELERRVASKEQIALYCLKCGGSWNAQASLVESIRRSLSELREGS